MRRMPLLVALCAAVVLALAPVAQAQQETGQGAGSDLDCAQLLPADASSPEAAQAEAQAILDADPSDPNGLDADGDGVACEFEASSTGEVSFEDGTGLVTDYASPAPQQYGQTSDLDCADFGSREEAQAALDADPADPSDLDADGDGIACEELFSAPPTQVEPPTQEDVPTGYEECEEFVAQTGSKIKCLPLQEAPTTQQAPAAQEEASEMPNELPATGGPDLALPSLAGAALLLTGLVSLALASRRRSRS